MATNSNGVALLDLANMGLGEGQTLEYETGDEILIIAHDVNNHDAIKYTVVGNKKSQTLNLNPVEHNGGEDNQKNTTQRLVSLLTGNTTGTVAYCKIYSILDGALLAHMETPGNDSRSINFGLRGLVAHGGFVIEREAKTLFVTVNQK